MTEVESKFDASSNSSPPPPPPTTTATTSTPGGSSLHKKQGRKSKTPTPIYRSNPGDAVASAAALLSPAASPPDAMGAMGGVGGIAVKKPDALMAASIAGGGMMGSVGGVGSATGQPIKSYSDFMRSLAAKYNNNEGTPTPTLDPFKPNPLSPPSTTSSSSLLSNPALHAFNLNSLFASASSSPSNPLGHLTSTQALLSLAAMQQQHTPPPPPPPAPKSPKSPRVSPAAKRPRTDSPLDLSGSPPIAAASPVKRARSSLDRRPSAESPRIAARSSPVVVPNGGGGGGGVSPAPPPPLPPPSASEVMGWSVDDVVAFVESVEICKEHAESFRDHGIDGASLCLLTDDHLTRRMGLKLGPALRLRAAVMARMGPAAAAVGTTPASDMCLHCQHCRERLLQYQRQFLLQQQTKPKRRSTTSEEA